VLLALIDVILVLARQRRFEALAIDEVKPEESVVLLPQVNVAIGAHLFEVFTEDRIVDLDRFIDYVGHGYCGGWGRRRDGVEMGSVKT